MNPRAAGTEPTRAQATSDGWVARPLAAHALRLAQMVLPFVAGWLAIRALQSWFLVADVGRWSALAVWLVQAIVVAAVASAVTGRLLRRFTPLVALLQMSLVFPDRVPSRFGLALRGSNVKQLLAAPRLKLSESAQAAAEEAVQLVSHLSRHEPFTRGHTERVRAYADIIGQQMELSDEDLNGLRWGALLHDIGKLTVPPEILNKPGKPTDLEWAILRQHPAAAIELLEPLRPWLGDWLLAASEHHERWDGNGYPAGLAQREISLAGRIVAVADAYDVMTSRRSYAKPRPAEAARSELVACAGTQFDPVVVRAMLEAGVEHKALAGRFGWVLELPGFGQLVGATGQAATAAAVAVVAVAASGPIVDAPEIDAPPAEVAFVEPEGAAVQDEPLVEAPTSVPATASSPTTEPADTTVDSSSPGSVAVIPTTTVAEAASVPSTAPTTTTAAPTSTTGTSTTTSSTTTTTTRPPTPCEAIVAGETDLAGSDLRGCDLRSITATGVDLTDARLDGVNLSGAVFTDFNLEGANLTGANLTGTELLRGSAVRIDLQDVSAQGLTVTDVDLAYSDLRDADLRNASLRSVSFGFAHLQGADLRGSTVVGTNFNDADVSRVNLAGVDLTGAEFYRSVVQETNLASSILEGAVFVDSVAVPTGIGTAVFVGTTCPDGSFGDTPCW